MTDFDPSAMEFLTNQPVCHVGVLRSDEPYVTPMSFVVADDRIMFRTATGHRATALQGNPRVCVEASEVDTDTAEWFSVIAWGDARPANDTEARQCRNLLQTKYAEAYTTWPPNPAPDQFSGGALTIVVEIDAVTSATSSGAMRPALRPGRL